MQHTETMLQTLQLMTSEPYGTPGRRPLAGARARTAAGMVRVPGGPFEMGAAGARLRLRQRAPAARASTSPRSRSTRRPSRNGHFAEFVEDGGYERREVWSEEGWRWRERGHRPAALLARDGDGFAVRSFAERRAARPGPAGVPRVVVRGRRLRALGRQAAADGGRVGEGGIVGRRDAAKRRYPWGDEPPTRERATSTSSPSAPRRPAPTRRASALRRAPDDRRRLGVDRQRLRAPIPAFARFPTAEYSAGFFGGPYRVLRGGSWATQPDAVSNTFRNWDYPQRRQIFAGFRCAMDVEDD